MIKVYGLRPLLAASSVLALLTGCSTIEGWFPDKHKQYQYSTEIAALEIPPDLSSSTIDGASGGSRPSWESPSSADDSAEAVSSDREATPAPGAEMSPEDAKAMRAGKDHPKPVLAESSSDVPLIEVQAPFDITWAEVNKALGRQKLEIIDQNRSDGLYFVHFAKNQKPYEGTQEYRIKLEEKSGVTSIYVQDSEGKPQRDGPGLDLLKQLNETLQNTALGGKGEKPAP